MNVLDSKKLQLACSNCSLSQLCLPLGLSQSEIEELDQTVKRRKLLHRGEYLYRESHAFEAIYAVRSGSFKTFKTTGPGEERIAGFYLPGEIMGFHAIARNRYGVSSIALETSSVCEIPFDELIGVAEHIPSLNRHLLELMSQKLSIEFSINPNSSAEERVAKFLMSLSKRLQQRKLVSHVLVLSMSREDIGRYLGLATETVSRVLSNFQKSHLLEVHRREIHIHDFRQLQLLALSETGVNSDADESGITSEAN